MNYLVVGLGNIGAEYAGTRHNMGFMALDAFAEASNVVFSTRRYGDVAEVSFKGRKITLLKPSTYINLSGNAVRYWLQTLKIPVENLLVICDDIALPFGTVRMRKSGSDGGHNGLKHIQETIGTKDYSRIRMGIGNEFHAGGQIDFVLGPLSDEQKAALPELHKKITGAIRSFVTVGPDRTMNSLNTKSSQMAVESSRPAPEEKK